jgi:hypothetical protein
MTLPPATACKPSPKVPTHRVPAPSSRIALTGA